MSRKKRSAARLTAVVVGLGLGGVVAYLFAPGFVHDSPAGPPPLGAQTVVAPAATPSPEPRAPAAVGAQPGDVLTVDPGTLPGGLLSYELVDQRYVVVDPAQAMPGDVAADLPAMAVTQLKAGSSSPGTRATALEAIDNKATDGTGRHAVVIFQVTGPTDADSHDVTTQWAFWGRTSASSYQSAPGSFDETNTAARAWISAHAPARFTIVVAQ